MTFDSEASSEEMLLVRFCKHDDRKAFEALYRIYSIQVFNYIHAKLQDREVAQDLTQDLFVNLWHRRHQLEISKLGAYLFGAAKHLIISYYRKQLSRERQTDYFVKQHPITEETTYQDTLVMDLRGRYQQALELLPLKCRQVYLLSRNGHSNREVATELGISEKTVEQHISKALRTLRTYLQDHLVYLPLLILLS
ncbi:RNA polymerase sigma-70 factor [Dyadobacter tibetensis]|uniref:RNA polymerase sigma-70 factor n=1 Tax=Dyadobacter tibetensis TaxID=1211851 RepID=UPI00046E62A2|nr:RNA polymerase sigma-70 factor [Dyadobacter tibetensis]